jgi:hypothetical protein
MVQLPEAALLKNCFIFGADLIFLTYMETQFLRLFVIGVLPWVIQDLKTLKDKVSQLLRVPSPPAWCVLWSVYPLNSLRGGGGFCRCSVVLQPGQPHNNCNPGHTRGKQEAWRFLGYLQLLNVNMCLRKLHCNYNMFFLAG